MSSAVFATKIVRPPSGELSASTSSATPASSNGPRYDQAYLDKEYVPDLQGQDCQGDQAQNQHMQGRGRAKRRKIRNFILLVGEKCVGAAGVLVIVNWK